MNDLKNKHPLYWYTLNIDFYIEIIAAILVFITVVTTAFVLTLYVQAFLGVWQLLLATLLTLGSRQNLGKAGPIRKIYWGLTAPLLMSYIMMGLLGKGPDWVSTTTIFVLPWVCAILHTVATIQERNLFRS